MLRHDPYFAEHDLPVDGLLVAGGRSRRFGSDKRFAVVDGDPMVLKCARTLRAVIDGTLFVAAGDRPPRLPGTSGAVFVRDSPPGRGPLGAIAAGLERAPGGVAVLACDVPRVRRSTLARVVVEGRRLGRIAAVRGPGGWEPLVAYYPRTALHDVRAALSHNVRALHRVLSAAGAVGVPPGDRSELRNVNRPADLES